MPAKEIAQGLAIADSLLEAFNIPLDNPAQTAAVLKEINDLRATLELGYNYNADPQIDQLVKKECTSVRAKWVMKIAEQQPAGYNDMQELCIAMENAINYRALSEADINKLLNILSPFENTSPSHLGAIKFHAG